MKRILLSMTLVVAASALAVGQVRGSATAGQKGAGQRRIHRIEALTAPEIDRLDRNRTLVILPIGMLEQHSRHLAIGADSYGVEFEVAEVTRRLARSLPGWNVVVMPMLPYGEGGANEIGNIQVHPGTYGIRHTTLRSIVADIGGQLAQNRFKWLFVIHGHGAPTHNVAISDACDFVSETFRVTMLNVTSIQWADPAVAAKNGKLSEKYYTSAEREAIGVDIHAGASETSGMLAVAPAHVRKVYRSLPEQSGKDFGELRRKAMAPGWEGHLSAPARAKVAYGREAAELSVEAAKDFILRAVRGENFFGRPRYPDPLMGDPDISRVIKDALANEQAFASKLEVWLKSKGKE